MSVAKYGDKLQKNVTKNAEYYNVFFIASNFTAIVFLH